MIALVVCVVNLRKIAGYLKRQGSGDEAPSPGTGTRKRRTGSSLPDFVAPELPLLVPGHGPPRPVAA
ncbi:hypothetical protein [Gulosibacter molinativorax]|nr:hypothetical protein [Gulosibacter molinativorax]